jgi:hypothetical protein
MSTARLRHYARAHIARLFGTAALLTSTIDVGCRADRVFQPDSDGEVSKTPTGLVSQIPGLGAPVPIAFDTYERSRQVVHPSVVEFPSKWHGQRFWLALTPYPNSDSRVENPSLFASASGDEWAVPSGLTNPVAKTSRGYLSDPELAYDPSSDELRLYYREVVETRSGHQKPRHRADVVYLTRSSDGVRWSPPQEIMSDAGRFVVSPTVARRAEGEWKMWSVDAGRAGCKAHETRVVMRASADGISWSEARGISLSQPGFLPWHLDVQYVPQLNAYWALVAAYPRGSACTGSSLFLATSSDGVQWTTYASPLLARGVLPQFSTNVYRSTFAFDADGKSLTLWITGATTVKRSDHRRPSVLRWSAAVWHTQPAALLEHVRTERLALNLADSEPSFLRRLAVENALP